MPYEDVMEDEEDMPMPPRRKPTVGGMNRKQAVPQGSVIALLDKMSAALQAMAQSKDMALMSQVMQMMDELRAMVGKIQGSSHYGRE